MHANKPVRMVLYGVRCYGDGELAIKILHVHCRGEAKLLLVAHADRLPGFALGPAQGGKQQAGQDGDDGDDNQQFDEGESGLLRFHSSIVRRVD